MIDTPHARQDPQPSLAAPAELFCSASRLSYLAGGTGSRAALMLHGWGDSKEIWRQAIVALAPHMRVFAPDLPGHGGSELGGSTSMADLSSRVGTFVAEQHLSQVDLVGHSMGGNVALELTLARPELVRSLVLVAPAVHGNAMPGYTRLYLHPAVGWAAMRASLALYGHLAALSRHVPHTTGLPYVTLLHRSVRALSHDPIGLRTLLRGLFDNPLGERLADVRVPTLVVNGELDLVVPASLSRQVAAAIPAARYAGLARSAHHPMDEQPREFQRLLTDFLGVGG